MIGVDVPRGIHTHICGIDLVRDSKTGDFYVLEDNVRTPSGISYVIENRLVMTRTFPDAFQAYEVLPVNHYPAELSRILRSLSPRGEERRADCSADAGHLQQRLLRAQLSRAADGHRAGGGPRPGGGWGRGVHEDHSRAQARGRDLHAAWTTNSSIRSHLSPDSLLGVAGLMGACRAGQRRAGQCGGQRRGRR